MKAFLILGFLKTFTSTTNTITIAYLTVEATQISEADLAKILSFIHRLKKNSIYMLKPATLLKVTLLHEFFFPYLLL